MQKLMLLVFCLELLHSIHHCIMYGLLAELGNKTEEVIFIQEKIYPDLLP